MIIIASLVSTSTAIIVHTLCLAIIAHGQCAWFVVYLLDLVYLQVLAEGIVVRYILGVGRQDDVSKLDAVLWQAVHKVEVEIAQELWEVMSDYKDYS